MKWGRKRQKITKKTLEEWIQINKKSQFDETLEFVQSGLRYHKTIEGKLDLFNYILTVLREDVKYSLIAEVMYKKEVIDLKHRFIPDYKNQDGDWVNIQMCGTERTREISLSDDCIIGIPWESERIWSKVTWLLKEPFVFDSNHQAVFFPELKVCFVLSGNHSIAVGVVYRKGVIEAKECSIIPAFDHLKSDGENWISIHTNQILEPVKDFRIAAMFEIARMKWQFEATKNK